MRKRVYLLIAATLLAAFALGIWEATRQVEPVYMGKPLSRWLAEVPDGWGHPLEGRLDPEERPAAANAVRAMGTNALPALIKMMEAQDWSPKRRLEWVAFTLGLIKLPTTTTRAERQNVRALFGFCALGTNANPALPALMDLLVRRGDSHTAVALAYMSPEGVLALSQALTNRDMILRTKVPHARFTIFLVLSQLAWVAQQTDTPPERRARLELHARLAAPSLLQCVSDPDAVIRIVAAERSVRLGVDRDKTMTVFTNCLTDPDPVIRKRAARDLSAFGPAATSAVPALVKALQDQEAFVRLAVTNALRKISPAAAGGAGITTNAPGT
jgi:HEAT repeat protein